MTGQTHQTRKNGEKNRVMQAVLKRKKFITKRALIGNNGGVKAWFISD
jgi:hypothetical protein